MERSDELIARIVRASRIPSAKRRLDLTRELRAHIDDFVADARRAGCSDSEIEGRLLARFGDPLEMGRNFGWVYRGDRAAFRVTAFTISALLVAGLTGGGILAVQSALTAGFGQPLSLHHISIELLDILASVAGYSGLLQLEELFINRALLKAIVLLMGITALAAAICIAINFSPAYVLFGSVNAMFLRSVQCTIKAPAFRFAVVLVVFAAFALLLARIEQLAYPMASMLASWLALGAGYQLMTGLAERAGRRLLRRMEHL